MIRITALVFCLVLIIAEPSFALMVNNVAPPIALRDNNGTYFYLSDYIGPSGKNPAKVIIVNFFASTCKPCRRELPALNSLVDEFEKKGVKIVIIGYKESFGELIEFLDELKVDKPIILSDPYGKTGKQYGVYGLPLTVLIGTDGKVKDIIRGELGDTEKALKERVTKFLK